MVTGEQPYHLPGSFLHRTRGILSASDTGLQLGNTAGIAKKHYVWAGISTSDMADVLPQLASSASKAARIIVEQAWHDDETRSEKAGLSLSLLQARTSFLCPQQDLNPRPKNYEFPALTS